MALFGQACRHHSGGEFLPERFSSLEMVLRIVNSEKIFLGAPIKYRGIFRAY
jgi:hypothetical protein